MPPPDELDSATWSELEELFNAALALPHAHREAFLDRACGTRSGMRTELEEMLAAAGPDRALGIESRLLGWDEHDLAAEGLRVGHYRLTRLLGRGGMGEVYLGHREDESFEQQVAIKVMRAGLFGPDLERRFLAERQILARLSHPFIVPLFDGGITDDNRPYLVMQYVTGKPITEYCDRNRLSVAARLRLLGSVCRAVQHAHANLVVHCDLKPSNILVTADGQPHLLDFGIAKLLGTGTASPNEDPQVQASWITPERAAPEQSRGAAVTTATDVYSLGVLLHELLAGYLPSRPSEDPSSPHFEPSGQKPSLAYAVTPPTSETVTAARVRNSTPSEMRRRLKRDLDEVVLKALEPAPERRYASAGQFSDELERFLDGKPVLAQADRWSYRTRKFVQRHLAAVLAATVALLLLVTFSMTSALQAQRIAAERDRVTAQEDKARQMLDLMVKSFESTNPDFATGGELMAIPDFLDETHSRIAALQGQPDLQARMEHMLGRIHLARTDYARALDLLTRAANRNTAPSEDEFTLELEIDLAKALGRTSDLKGAVSLLRDLLPRLRRVFGLDHRLVAQSLVRLSFLISGEEGQRLAQEALAIERRRDLPEPTGLGYALSGVAHQLRRAGDDAQAAVHFRQSVEIYRKTLGDEHPSTQAALTNLAGVIQDFDEQVTLYQQVIEIGRRVFGAESPPVANRLANLGVLLRDHGVLEEAESSLSQAAAIWQSIGGPKHWRTYVAWMNLATVYELQHRLELALELNSKARAMASVSTVADPRILASITSQQARLLSRHTRLDEAVALAREAIVILEQPGGLPPDRGAARMNLGHVLLVAGQPDEAEAVLTEALELLRGLADEDPRVGEAECLLGRSLAELDRKQEARPLLESGLAMFGIWPGAYTGDVEACRAVLAG